MGRFILSCTTCALRAPGKDELLETMKYAPQTGFKYWGVAGPVFWSAGVPRWVDAAKIKRAAKESGLAGMTEVYAGAIPTDDVKSAKDYVENSLVYSARLADELECPLLVFSGGKRRDGVQGLDVSIEGLNRLLPLIEGLRVKVALEPHYRSQFQDERDYDYIFGRFNHPQLGITVDTGHFHSAQVDTKAFIRKFASKVWNVHLKDHVGTQSVNIGDGEIDLKGIFAELMSNGYEGPLALEIEPEDTENLPIYVGRSLQHITGLLDELGAVYE